MSPWRRKQSLFSREEGTIWGVAMPVRNMSEEASPFHRWKGQAQRNETAGVAGIQTGHLATGSALKTAE